MNKAGGSGRYEEHHFRKVILGNIDAVRQRLAEALEDFDYIVVSENPLQAKRPQRRNIITANILEYDTNLTVALRPISQASTLATFDYTVSYLFSKAERLTLEREADAMIALATAPLNKAICPACNTEYAGAVRFCRVCGTPVARNRLPAEIEVMRLMAGTSAAQVEIGWGVGSILLTLLITLPMILLGGTKAVNIGLVLFGIGLLLGSYFLLYGMRRLHKTITPQPPAPEFQSNRPQELATPEKIALPSQPASVVEGTTELMSQPEAVPVVRVKDTGSMD